MDNAEAYVRAAALLGAAIAVSIGGIGPALGQGFIGTKACESIGKNPENAGTIRTSMIIAMSITESTGIYALLIAIMLVFAK